MTDDHVHFRARAAAEQTNADAAALTNVRERAQRAADSWSKMADRAERTQTLRVQRDAANQARVAAGE